MRWNMTFSGHMTKWCSLHFDSTLLHIKVKNKIKSPTKLTFIFHAVNIHVPTINMIFKCLRYATCASYFMCAWDNYVSIYTSCELNEISDGIPITGIHTFHIIEICPSTYMPATLHMYLPLHYSCSLPVDSHITAYIRKTSMSLGFGLSSNMYTFLCHLATISILFHQWPTYVLLACQTFCFLYLCQKLWKMYTHVYNANEVLS